MDHKILHFITLEFQRGVKIKPETFSIWAEHFGVSVDVIEDCVKLYRIIKLSYNHEKI